MTMSDNRTTELLPCPFCGGNARLTTWTPTAASISCIMCGAHFNTYNKAEAIAAWNTRAYLNPDGLPAGLTISDDGNLLNWRGENYVKQAECDKWKAKAEEAGRAMNAAAGLWAKADAENRELRKMLLLDDGTIEEYTERADPLTALAYQKQLAEEWRDRCHNAEALCDKLEAERDELNATLGSGTCEVECFDDGVDEGLDGEWFSYAPPTWYLSCGHTSQGTEKPNFCPSCGRKVE